MNLFLTIAPSDTSGGAGIHQDSRVAEKLGYHSLCVITAITTQTFTQVFEVYPLKASMVVNQLKTIDRHFKIKALKIGAIVEEDQINIISSFIANSTIPVKVLDPVFVSSSGKVFLSKGLVDLYKQQLLPFVNFLTPNKLELEWLSGNYIDNFEQAVEKAFALHQKYGCGVYVKGGHFTTINKKIKEALVYQSNVTYIEKQRLHLSYSHGTGCAFSTALAIFLSKGFVPVEAAKLATSWVNDFFLQLNAILHVRNHI